MSWRRYEVQWSGDELRPDMFVWASEGLHNTSDEPEQIMHSDSVTVESRIEVSAGLDLFDTINASFSYSFSRSRTFSNTYQGYVEPGRHGRMIYVPMMRHINGWLVTYKDQAIGPPLPGVPVSIIGTEPELDRQWCPCYFPIDGGYYEMAYNEAMFYVDNNYGGAKIALGPGKYDWGTIPNDQISSLKVPKWYFQGNLLIRTGLRVTLYDDTHFQGRSKTFEVGDYPYVGDDFNDITSSIVVEESAGTPTRPLPTTGNVVVSTGNDVVVYDDSQYQGYGQVLPVGRYDWGHIHNDTISSLKVPAGRKVILYSDTRFSGKSKTFTQDAPYVGDDMNDQTSSIIVE
jgi:hypothetical protein